MTDISKYKNVSLSHKTYEMIDTLRKQLVDNTILSRSQTISILVNEINKKLKLEEVKLFLKLKNLKKCFLYLKSILKIQLKKPKHKCNTKNGYFKKKLFIIYAK